MVVKVGKDFNNGLALGLASGESLDNLVLYRGRLDLKEKVTTKVYISKLRYYEEDMTIVEPNVIDLELEEKGLDEKPSLVELSYEEQLGLSGGSVKELELNDKIDKGIGSTKDITLSDKITKE